MFALQIWFNMRPKCSFRVKFSTQELVGGSIIFALIWAGQYETYLFLPCEV